MYENLTEKQEKTLVWLKEQTIDRCKVKGCNTGRIVKNGDYCTCYKAFKWLVHLVGSNIPKDYWTLELSELEIPDSIKGVVIEGLNNYEAMMEQGLGFIFTGTNGIGKTSLLCEIGKFFLRKYKKVFYTLGDQLVRSAMNPDLLNTTYDWDYFDVILIDEFEKIYIKAQSDYSIKEIEKFLRSTIPYGKVVCIATNSTEDELIEQFGVSPVSAFRGNLKFVNFIQADKRVKLQDAWMDRLKKREDLLNNKIINFHAERFFNGLR